MTTPTAAPTVNYGTGAITPTLDTTVLTTAYLRSLTLQEVEDGAGAYQQADRVLECKLDELPVDPTTDSVFTVGDDRYAVVAVTRDEHLLRWLLVGRRTP